MTKSIAIQVFRWAGSWGPFKVNIPCGECSLTTDIIQDTIENELDGISVKLDVRDWLTEWWKPLMKGGWHAPIIIVEGKVISQGRALNRGVLTQAVIEFHASKTPVLESETVVFGKESCPHCVRAKKLLDDSDTQYVYRDVVKEPRALYEMLARVKPIIREKTPVTVPQIWVGGSYIGGALELSEKLHAEIEANSDRGHCSLSSEGVAS
jgi:glutaredoxin